MSTGLLIDGDSFHKAAMFQACEMGEDAALSGKPRDANPYATEIDWKGNRYCPTEEQRDEWWRGYDAAKPTN